MKNILIIRPSALGDIVMASPLIEALKTASSTKIYWLIEPHLADLLKYDPNLAGLISWPKKQWIQHLKAGRLFSFLKEVKRLKKELTDTNFDLAIDAQGLLRSRILARLSCATERIGFTSREPGKSLMTRIISRGSNSQNMSSEYYYLIQKLGLDCGDFKPKIYVSPKDESNVIKRLQEKEITKYAVFAPFTTRPQKHWFEERWAALATRVVERFKQQILVLGGKDDQSTARRLCRLSSVPIHNFTGQTTLGQAAAMVKNSSLLIGVDTGLTHLGTAFNRPTVALFGSTCPYLQTTNLKYQVLYQPLPCSPCRRSPTCNGDYTCMKLLDTERVLKAADEVLSYPDKDVM